MATAWVLFQGYWNPTIRLKNGWVRLAGFMDKLLLVLPSLVGAIALPIWWSLRATRLSVWELVGGAIVMVGPQIVLGLVTGWRTSVAERRAAGDTDPVNLRQARWFMIQRNLAVPGVMLCSVMLIGFGLSILLVAVIGVVTIPLLLIRGGLHFSQSGFEMEQSPLRDEISAIAAQFGGRCRRVIVRPTRNLPQLDRPMLIPLNRGAWSDSRDSHVIPLVHFQQLDPEVLTVGLAQRWARRITTGSFYGTKEVGPATRAMVTAGATGCGIVAIPVIALLGLMILGGIYAVRHLLVYALFGQGPPVDGAAAVLGVVYGGVVVAGVIFMMVRSLGGLPTRFEVHKNAFMAWSGTEDPGIRNLPDYAAAYARFLAYTRVIQNPAVVLLQLKRDRALVRLLETGSSGTIEKAWKAVERALGMETAQK